MPLVSIIVPCFNHASLLPETLASVIQQTHANWECVVVDDGSTDATEVVVKAFANRDPRIKYLYKENGGLSSARNHGLDHVSGVYIQFLDADDLMEPRKLELQLSSLVDTPPKTLSLCDYRFGHGDRASLTLHMGTLDKPRFITPDLFGELIERWETALCIPIHAFLFKARLFQDDKLRFDESLPNHEDWDCWLRLFHSGVQVKPVFESLATYRISESSMTADKRKMWRGTSMVCQKHAHIYANEPNTVKAFRQKRAAMRRLYLPQIIRQKARHAVPKLFLVYRQLVPEIIRKRIRSCIGLP